MTAITWTTDPDTGVTWSHDGRYDILEGPDGYMLRENIGDDQSPDWNELDTYDNLTGAQAAAEAYAPAYSPHSSEPDGYDRNPRTTATGD